MSCETAHNDSAKHWKGDNGEIAAHQSVDQKSNCYRNAFKKFENAKGDYIDAHMWRFTPQSFYYTVESLGNMGEIDLEIEKVYDTPTNSHEFCVILRKKAS